MKTIVAATEFCRCDLSHEFKLVWIRATYRSDKLRESALSQQQYRRGDVSQRRIAAIWRIVCLGLLNALICALIFHVTEVCIRYPVPMWPLTAVIDTFFAFWSFLVVQQNFNFRFQCPCYKPGAHAQYTIRWSMLRLELRASLGPAINKSGDTIVWLYTSCKPHKNGVNRHSGWNKQIEERQ